MLLEAEASGKKLGTYVRLSGPGWLQSAITLGGGSLAGSLFLGVMGGTSMLWLQLLAITLGVVMLSAISYVTLSTGRRPFEAINSEINPALGWGWLLATMLANMIWCMPQFSLAYDALDKNLVPLVSAGGLGDADNTKWIVSAVLLAAAGCVVLLNVKQGTTAKIFDWVLKGLIGMVVICFFGVVALLTIKGELDFAAVFSGFIPNPGQWTGPTGELAEVAANLPAESRDYWINRLVGEQQSVMIASAATAVGINMTFLLPYSMLARGWDRPFRGLARFDLATGMAIPYVLVTSCVVIAAAASFHSKLDPNMLSDDVSVVQSSPQFAKLAQTIAPQLGIEKGDDGTFPISDADAEKIAGLSLAEKKFAAAVTKRDAFELAETLAPLLGAPVSKLVFGLGVFGMGFSTIIILMLINGYVFREISGRPDSNAAFIIGCLVAGISGALWVVFWSGGAKFWLPIIASTFGSMLLPIAYVTFFLMMNSTRILGADRPRGASAILWNVLMLIAVAGSIAAAYAAIVGQMNKSSLASSVVIGLLVVYGIALVVGHFSRLAKSPAVDTSAGV
ncbi:MAG: divalent metal cation transporter [Planctomycetota bacterium]